MRYCWMLGFLFLLVGRPAAAAPDYDFQILTAPPGLVLATNSAAVNDKGTVVATFRKENGFVGYTVMSSQRGRRWHTVLTFGSRIAVDVNVRSKILGYDDTTKQPFIWSGGRITEYSLGGRSAVPEAINIYGDFVGTYVDESGQEWAYRYLHNGRFDRLTTGSAYDINDFGEVCGMQVTTNASGQHIYQQFLFTDEEGLVLLGDGGAVGLNNATVVTGGDTFATRWTYDGGLENLAASNGRLGASGLAINDRGWIAGAEGFDAFLWTPKYGIVYLIGYAPSNERPLWLPEFATGINRRGDIVGTGERSRVFMSPREVFYMRRQ